MAFGDRRPRDAHGPGRNGFRSVAGESRDKRSQSSNHRRLTKPGGISFSPLDIDQSILVWSSVLWRTDKMTYVGIRRCFAPRGIVATPEKAFHQTFYIRKAHIVFWGRAGAPLIQIHGRF